MASFRYYNKVVRNLLSLLSFSNYFLLFGGLSSPASPGDVLSTEPPEQKGNVQKILWNLSNSPGVGFPCTDQRHMTHCCWPDV